MHVKMTIKGAMQHVSAAASVSWLHRHLAGQAFDARKVRGGDFGAHNRLFRLIAKLLDIRDLIEKRQPPAVAGVEALHHPRLHPKRYALPPTRGDAHK